MAERGTFYGMTRGSQFESTIDGTLKNDYRVADRIRAAKKKKSRKKRRCPPSKKKR